MFTFLKFRKKYNISNNFIVSFRQNPEMHLKNEENEEFQSQGRKEPKSSYILSKCYSILI